MCSRKTPGAQSSVNGPDKVGRLPHECDRRDGRERNGQVRNMSGDMSDCPGSVP